MRVAAKPTWVAVLMGSTLCVFLGAALSIAAQADPVEPKTPEPRNDYAVEFHPLLKDNANPIPELLGYGPDAAACVKFEPAGLHITLPPGYTKQRPGTGVVTDFGVKGDFEIAIAFEILLGKTADPPANYSNLRLMVVPNEPAEPEVWQKAGQNRAVMAREINSPKGAGAGWFFANATTWNPVLPRDKWNNEDFTKIEQQLGKRSPAASLKGRLRLVRRGGELFYFASDGSDKDFQLVLKSEFGAKDLKNVRVLASTGVSGDALDVLVTDLSIRADGFVKAAALPPPSQPPMAEPRSLVVPIIIAGAVLGVLIFAAPLCLWLFLRKGHSAAAATATATPTRAAMLLVTCSHCGARMKTRPERAARCSSAPIAARRSRRPTARRKCHDCTRSAWAFSVATFSAPSYAFWASAVPEQHPPPPPPTPTMVPAGPVGDEAILLALDAYEPVYKVDANSRVIHLRLGGRHLPVSVLAEIAKLKELRGLTFWGTDVSDDGLAYLKDLSKLTTLELRDTAITDRGLVHLENLASLQYVWLPKKTVTKEAADILKNSLPEIKGVYRP